MTDDEIERAMLGVWQDVPGAVNFGTSKPLKDAEMEGDKLSPPLKSEYLSEKSLNKFVEKLKATNWNNRISIKPTQNDS